LWLDSDATALVLLNHSSLQKSRSARDQGKPSDGLAVDTVDSTTNQVKSRDVRPLLMNSTVYTPYLGSLPATRKRVVG